MLRLSTTRPMAEDRAETGPDTSAIEKHLRDTRIWCTIMQPLTGPNISDHHGGNRYLAIAARTCVLILNTADLLEWKTNNHLHLRYPVLLSPVLPSRVQRTTDYPRFHTRDKHRRRSVQSTVLTQRARMNASGPLWNGAGRSKGKIRTPAHLNRHPPICRKSYTPRCIPRVLTIRKSLHN